MPLNDDVLQSGDTGKIGTPPAVPWRGEGRQRRILYLTPYIPSPIRVRPYQLIRALARQGHHITVAALDTGDAETRSRGELEAVCEAVHVVPVPRVPAALRCLAALPTGTPLWAAYTQAAEMSRLLRHLTTSQTFDIAHVEHLRAAHFAHDLGNLPRVLDAVDCITALRRQMVDLPDLSLPQRLFSWEEWTKLRRYEPRVYRAFGRVAVTSDFDANALHALDPYHSLPSVIPNGVDMAHFHPSSTVAPEPGHVIFSGKMSYAANDDAARFLLTKVLPRLRVLYPGVRVAIAGSNPSRKLRSLASRMEHVEVTGTVEDLRPYLWRASVALVPLRVGVGIQNKVLETLAVGRPVVCTSLAARALQPSARAGVNPPVRIADDAGALAGVCAELLLRPEAAAQAGNAGRAFVEQYHTWEAAAEKFTKLYDAVLAPR